MSKSRLRFLQNQDFNRLGTEVEKHIESWIASSNPEITAGLLDDVCLGVLTRVFRRIGGSEGTVWLADPDESSLVAVINSGPDEQKVVGFQQPIGSGIISMVYAQQQPYCENEISAKAGHDDTLDRQTNHHTRAMIAIPFYFAFGLRGVISCVQLDSADDPKPTGFEASHVDSLAKAGNNVERLVNGRLLSVTLGFDEG